MRQLGEYMHVKRSPEFEKKLAAVIIGLMNGEQDAIADAIEILKRNTTDSRCMVNARDDEPVFVLRGKDKLAAETVEFWAEKYSRPILTTEMYGKYRDALKCGVEMRSYAEAMVGARPYDPTNDDNRLDELNR